MTPRPTDEEIKEGIPLFLDQLGAALRTAESSDVIDHEQMQLSAGKHGEKLYRLGLTVAQVVHDYGDVCQAITEMAVTQQQRIPGPEFQTLNLCLDDAIAGAVTGYARRAEAAKTDLGAERLGVLAHELRVLLNTAMISFEGIRSGRVSANGSTGVVHSRSLMGLRELVDRSLAEVRLEAGITRRQPIAVTEFIEEVEIGALLLAKANDIPFAVTSPVDRTLTIEGDRQTLAAALSNLLHNAFAATREHGSVSLTTRATADRVLFEIQDERTNEAMAKLEENKEDRNSAAAMGLDIARKAAKANGGEVRVRTIPDRGCLYTLDLPRSQPPRGAFTEKAAGRSRQPR